MMWLRSIAREIVGLFVDEVSFAIAILVWLVAMVVVLPRTATVSGWFGPVFFVGLAAILVESVLRFARRKK